MTQNASGTSSTTARSSAGLFESLAGELVAAAAAIAPRIVQVIGRPRRPASGIAIGPERVLTTSHSVEWEEGIQIRLDAGRRLEATAAGHDRGADVVLLRVPGLDVPAVSWSAAAPAPGTLGLLTGRSWRGAQQVRLTMLTSIAGPMRTASGTKLDGLQVLSAGVYPGFSGSAVVAPSGEVLAMATAGLVRGTAIGIPAGVLRTIVETLETHGGVPRGYLGVTTQPVRLGERQASVTGQAQGLLVIGLAADGPAAGAGVLVGDVIVSFAGQPLERPEDLMELLSAESIGRQTETVLVRGLSRETLQIEVERRPGV